MISFDYGYIVDADVDMIWWLYATYCNMISVSVELSSNLNSEDYADNALRHTSKMHALFKNSYRSSYAIRLRVEVHHQFQLFLCLKIADDNSFLISRDVTKWPIHNS